MAIIVDSRKMIKTGSPDTYTRVAPSLTYTITFQVIAIAAVVVAWYVLTATHTVTSDQLPGLGSTLTSIKQIFTQSSSLNDLAVSASELVVAFVLATIAGIGFGFLLGEFGRHQPAVRRVIETGLGTSLATPKFIFLPVLVLLIGAGYWEKVIYALSDGVIIMILSASAAAYTVGENERVLARSYRMSRIQFFWKIFVPSALLPVIEALRISMVLVVSGVMLAEMYISNAGMGFLIFEAGTENQVPLLVGAILVVAALAVLLNSMFQLIEKSIGKWHA